MVYVTLGIPTMNNQRTIWSILAGFADQTCPPDRIHIVDASTDWTPYIIQLFQVETQPPFELELERQIDSTGVGAARNQIYEKFEGDMLACFDTPAVPERQWLEKHLRTHNDMPSVDMVSGANNLHTSGLVESPHKMGYFVQNNCSIKRQAIDRVEGWDRNFERGEDWDIAIRLWLDGATGYARNDLNKIVAISDGLQSRLRTRLSRPSSVRYLRKYGVWYMKFHPAHVFGDMVSMLSIIAVIFAFLSAPIFGSKSFLLLILPLLGTIGYGGVRFWSEIVQNPSLQLLLRILVEFYILGYSAGREIILGPRNGWNYSGVY